MRKGVSQGNYQLVYITPELLIEKTRWRKLLSSSVYEDRLKGFVIDEAHCVKKW